VNGVAKPNKEYDMPWTNLDNLSAEAPLPEGYRYERLTREDIPVVVRSLAEWYPGIAVGNSSCHLDERFYNEKVVLDGEPERDFFVVLFKKGRELAGALSVERDRDSEVLYGRVGAVSPQHRGWNLKDTMWNEEMRKRKMNSNVETVSCATIPKCE
jgi:hypothetical protein